MAHAGLSVNLVPRCVQALKELCDKCRFAMPDYHETEGPGGTTVAISLPQARSQGGLLPGLLGWRMRSHLHLGAAQPLSRSKHDAACDHPQSNHVTHTPTHARAGLWAAATLQHRCSRQPVSPSLPISAPPSPPFCPQASIPQVTGPPHADKRQAKTLAAQAFVAQLRERYGVAPAPAAG